MQAGRVIRRRIHHGRINHVEESGTDLLLQRRSVHFMAWLHRGSTKILRRLRVESDEPDQMANYQSDRHHSQQPQSFNVRMSREVDAQVAAPDRDEVRCTGGCLIVRLLHPTVKRSDARWRLFDFRRVEGSTIVWLRKPVAVEMQRHISYFWIIAKWWNWKRLFWYKFRSGRISQKQSAGAA